MDNLDIWKTTNTVLVLSSIYRISSIQGNFDIFERDCKKSIRILKNRIEDSKIENNKNLAKLAIELDKDIHTKYDAQQEMISKQNHELIRQDHEISKLKIEMLYLNEIFETLLEKGNFENTSKEEICNFAREKVNRLSGTTKTNDNSFSSTPRDYYEKLRDDSYSRQDNKQDENTYVFPHELPYRKSYNNPYDVQYDDRQTPRNHHTNFSNVETSENRPSRRNTKEDEIQKKNMKLNSMFS